MKFKTSEELIKDCEANFEQSWIEFANRFNVTQESDPLEFNTSKKIFRAGYMHGVEFVSAAFLIQRQLKNIDENMTKTCGIKDPPTNQRPPPPKHQ